MKRNLLFLFVLAVLISIPVQAQITVEETTDAEYLINSGFSQSLAEDVFVLKKRNLGEPIERLYETSDNFLVRGWKKFYSYLDPAQENYDRVHHDIEISPSASDL